MRRSLSVTFLGMGYAGMLCGTIDGDRPLCYSWDRRQGAIQRTHSFYPSQIFRELRQFFKTLKCFQLFFYGEKKHLGREIMSQSQKIKNSEYAALKKLKTRWTDNG